MTDLIHIFQPGHYSFNPYFIPPFLIAFLIFLFGLFVLSLEKRSNFNRSFLYLCLSATLWLCGQCLLLNSNNEQSALLWSHVMYSGLIFMASTIFHISITYTHRYHEERSLVISNHLVAGLLVATLWKGHFFEGLHQYAWGVYPAASVYLLFFFIFLIFNPVLGLINLVSYWRTVPTSLARKQTKHLIIAFIFVSLNFIDICPSFGIAIYPFGYLAALCFFLTITYSIAKYHNLMARRYAGEMETEVNKKTAELSKTIEQLKTTQVRLIEAGKISAMASLSAGILHQITQPITAIHGFVKFMKKEMKEDDPFLKPVKLMDEQTVYLKEMLEDLMELIRHRKILKKDVDVNTCLKKATDLLTDEMRIRYVKLDLILAANLPRVYADSVHLQQIFMNIMVNALQALSAIPDKSKRRLRIESLLDEADGNVTVILQDNGPGFSPEDQHNIFDPFFSTKTKGSGIGLALCKDLIAEHGGSVTVESNMMEGARFIIKFPPSSNQNEG